MAEPTSPEEFSAAFTSVVAYSGTFEVDEVQRNVIHHVKASTYPNWAGTDLVRRFEFAADGRLILSTNEKCPPGMVNKLKWRRS